MIEKVETYEPRNELEKFGADAFRESPNTKMLSKMLEGQNMKDSILSVAEKCFIDGFITALKSLEPVFDKEAQK